MTLMPLFVKQNELSTTRQSSELLPAYMNPFRVDADRILSCNAFRRLKHKTQVFLNPSSDHYRERMSHTLEVANVAKIIAEALGYNSIACEAIALGHDLGHTPFGHAGEDALEQIHPGGFEHCVQSLRVVDTLEHLNLTHTVRDGILNHRSNGTPATIEGKVVQLSDKIAYLTHDMNDAIYAGILEPTDVPEDVQHILGTDVHARRDIIIASIVKNSSATALNIDADVYNAIQTLRTFMFQNVYKSPLVKKEERRAKEMIKTLYRYFKEHPFAMPPEYTDFSTDSIETKVCDYISGMTDHYAVEMYKDIFLPKAW